MTQDWGRSSSAGLWPHRAPVWTVGVILLALASGGAVATARFTTVWSPLERAYAPTLGRCRLMAGLGLSTTGRYRLLEVEGLGAPRLAFTEEVQPDATKHDASAFVLTDLGRRLGDVRHGS